ncbi:MAG: isoleucine--tRNA ligase, partial [Bacteroidetes bacterium]
YVKEDGQEEDRAVDVDIGIKRKDENERFHAEKDVHSYPHCWRTDRPVLYYPLDSWFIKASAVKERMQNLNDTINWKPKSTGEGRFGKWLENLQDWNLSRSRYWGVPLPIWRTEDGSHEKCIGSVEELSKEVELANQQLGLNQTTPDDLHRPYMDDVVLVSEDGKPMKRETDLIDVWFDSGAMPYAQWHYPFENKEIFERSFPADFIAEGVDQTRGWFYTLHAIATMVFDNVAFKTVVSNGLVQDKNGKKMSKRLGNAVEPFETIAKYGADATRWYMLSNAQVWDNLKFDIAGLDEVRRKFFGTLYNTYAFFVLYANVDKFEYKEAAIPVSERPEIDRWIISRLNTLVKEVDAEYNSYEATNGARKIMAFVDDHLSNWYVRLSRRRFWKGDYSQDKISAYQTLYECLVTLMKLMAPLAPFFSDWMYRNLNNVTKKENHESIHLADFPTPDEAVIDKALEERMDYAQRIASLVLSLRKKDKLRVRQPLKRVLLPVLNDSFRQQVEEVKNLILAEVNVKEIEYIADASGVINKKVKPNFKTLGRRLGKDMKEAMKVITGLGQNDINEIEKTGSYTLAVNGSTYDLTLEDFEIQTEDIPGWHVASDGPLVVALDITITPELEAEGMARDVVNRIQNIRKEKDFDVTDRINVSLEKLPELDKALEMFEEYIKHETLIDQLSFGGDVSNGQEIDLPGDVVAKILVEKV